MLYRKFGQLDFMVSALGFGCMRLPVIDGDAGKIDEQEAIAMIRYGIDQGINYVDTAYFYHQGQSELLLAKALQDGYRDKVKLATKLPVGQVESYDDFDRLLNEQLKKLNTDQIDFYLMHGLNGRSWANIKRLGYEKFLEKALSDGRIAHVGFSFHDQYPLFEHIVNDYPWTFCQIQLNYMDTEYQAGLSGLKLAAKKGMAVIIMEPVKGGKLVNPPQSIQALWDQLPVKHSPADWALRWVLNHPEVAVVLSGMSTMEQVRENIATASQASAHSLNAEELAVFDQVKEAYLQLKKIDCTACGYCQPCPSGVDIPRNFALYNEAFAYNALPASRSSYMQFLAPEARASSCTECSLCEIMCPQQLTIRQHLKEVARTLN